MASSPVSHQFQEEILEYAGKFMSDGNIFFAVLMATGLFSAALFDSFFVNAGLTLQGCVPWR